jgi:hypothetical protein
MGVDPGLQQTDHAQLLVVADSAPVRQPFSRYQRWTKLVNMNFHNVAYWTSYLLWAYIV